MSPDLFDPPRSSRPPRWGLVLAISALVLIGFAGLARGAPPLATNTPTCETIALADLPGLVRERVPGAPEPAAVLTGAAARAFVDRHEQTTALKDPAVVLYLHGGSVFVFVFESACLVLQGQFDPEVFRARYPGVTLAPGTRAGERSRE